MKILVIGLDRAEPEMLLGDERLATIRSLMEAGTYGRLASPVPADSPEAWTVLATGRESGSTPGPTIWDHATASGGNAILVRIPEDVALDDASDGYGQHLDAEIAKVLETVTEEALVLVASSRGAFILAAPHLPAFGEIDDARLIDLATTLLELADLPTLPDAQGRNILEGRSPIDGPQGGSWDDDELVRERLRGLGYIG